MKVRFPEPQHTMELHQQEEANVRGLAPAVYRASQAMLEKFYTEKGICGLNKQVLLCGGCDARLPTWEWFKQHLWAIHRRRI